MTQQSITLTTDDGAATTVPAEITAYTDAARVGKATAFAVAGLVGGGACIIVPVLHLVTTWALPLAGIVMCLKTLKVREKLGSVTGPCPACGETIDLAGGPLREALHRQCPKCRVHLDLRKA